MKKLPKETVRIRFKGFVGWLLSDSGFGRAIAPLEHCDSEGNVIELFAISFAHFYPERDVISRFGEKIGTSKDLQVLSALKD